ncbi:GNAT family N-acetyltransferase [Noviherbaspirillum suwonense]|jgi:GNAT superfamily N-acetyltransferase|uniref:GNAT family N-acetyltransferase n=1 Tax=Noviherbaspirillum suwonense TaxID=1224511 RepID=UPI0024B81C0F|nr:GNAT family N-acetyltransferase [Noviherbaspirillum suwonense]
MKLHIQLDDSVNEVEVMDLYRKNNWSAAEKPAQLMAALANSHCLVTARLEKQLVGIGNAISDEHLVVYYPHMLVHPAFHRKGIGKEMMRAMQTKYSGFHQQILVADGDAIEFYRSLGFALAGRTQSMWIYAGSDH